MEKFKKLLTRIHQEINQDSNLAESSEADSVEDSYHFDFLNDLGRDSAPNIAYEFSLSAGLSEKWTLALALLEWMSSQNFDFSEEQALWKLKCLEKLERYSEVLVFYQNYNWSSSALKRGLHAVEKSLHKLGMGERFKQLKDALQYKA